MPRNQIRIIAGRWKGRRLHFPPAAARRPTPARVRETLFNWLAADIEGADCLDLFAGSGALGFEALSRGAATLFLVDSDRRAVAELKENCALLDAARTLVRRQSALGFLNWAAHAGAQALGKDMPGWDGIFLDPPFASDLLPKALALLQDGCVLRPQGWVYFEAPRRAALQLDGWAVHRESAAGDSRFGLLRRC